MVKSLRLSWLGRFLNRTNESWLAIPNDFFNRYGGLPFLLKCYYDSKLLDKPPPLFSSKMLDYYFKELRTGHFDGYRREFILWNNEEITIENKSIFWAHLFEKGICFVEDLLVPWSQRFFLIFLRERDQQQAAKRRQRVA